MQVRLPRMPIVLVLCPIQVLDIVQARLPRMLYGACIKRSVQNGTKQLFPARLQSSQSAHAGHSQF